MIKKAVKTEPVTRIGSQPLKDRLMTAVQKVLIGNKSVLTDKIQKVIAKSIKRIVKKTDKQAHKALKTT